VKRQIPIKFELLRINHSKFMMHEKKLFTSYSEWFFPCNRISNA